MRTSSISQMTGAQREHLANIKDNQKLFPWASVFAQHTATVILGFLHLHGPGSSRLVLSVAAAGLLFSYSSPLWEALSEAGRSAPVELIIVAVGHGCWRGGHGVKNKKKWTGNGKQKLI